MVALRIDQNAAPASGNRTGNRTYEAHRRASLIERMSGQYWRIVRRERVLRNIGAVVHQDLQLFPSQCSESIKHLSALRAAAQAAHHFFSTLDPYAMKAVCPWGIMTQLAYLDDQVTELLLLLDAFTLICTEPSYARVQLQLVIRHLYPAMMVTFDATSCQLKALVEKAKEQAEVQA